MIHRLLPITLIGALLALLIFYIAATRPPALFPQPAALAQQAQAAATIVPTTIPVTATVPATGQPAGSTAVTTIRWLMRWDETRVTQIAQPLIAAFEAQYPTIRVELENIPKSSDYYRTLDLAFTGGDPPDVFYPSTVVAHAAALQGMLLPLDSLVAADGLDLAAYDPASLALYRTAEQGYYCLPLDRATLAVVYNKDLFDAAGVAYPQAPWTWADLLTIARQLTRDATGDSQPEQYGIDRFDAYWPLSVWTATGQNVFDDPFAPTAFLLDEKAAIAALQWQADLSLVEGVMPPVADEEATGEPPDRFLTGQVAMQIIGHWRVPALLAQPNLHFDFVELPGGNFTANRSDGSCFAIAHNTAHPEAAWAFVNFLAGPAGEGAALLTEQQQVTPALLALQQAPAFLNPTALPDYRLAAFLPQSDVRFSLYDPLHPIYRRWEAAADKALDDLWRGERNAKKVVATLADEAEEILRNLQPLTTTLAAEAAAPVTATVFVAPPVTPTLGLTMTLAVTVPLPPPRQVYVARNGDDQATGDTPLTAFATLQHALNQVQPGDTIHLLPGDYRENVVSAVDGRADAPITIMGSDDAILRGSDAASAAFYLTHNYYTLVGFTIDGLFGDPDTKEGYTQKLLYVQGTQPERGVTGLRVLNMTLRNAGGECLRLRYFAHRNEIAYSTFTTCGLLDFAFGDGGKNGEAIYIGTSSSQWDDGKNPTADPDASRENWIHHNVMNTQGNECVEIKEGASANLVEQNSCTGQLDPDSGGIGVRGSGNVIRYNVVYGNVGAGVRLGGHEVDGVQYGVANEVYGNQLFNNVAGGLNVAIGPQAKICGNQLAHNLGKAIFGDGGKGYAADAPC
ncbi:MAG: extracellular solute-binding protein [Caldilineaceae bacterium]